MAELNNSGSGTWSETDASNVSPSPDGWPNGTFPNQVEPIGRSTMGAIKRFWDRINGNITVGGSANAITLTPVNTSYPTVYVAAEVYQFKAISTNTGPTTININGLGLKNLFKVGASGPIALTGGEIVAGSWVTVNYDGTQFQLTTSSLVDSSSQIAGTTTNDNAPTGYIGEFQSSVLASTSGLSLVSDVSTNIVSLTLSAGDWDVRSKAVVFPASGTQIGYVISSISTTSATPSGVDDPSYTEWMGLLTGNGSSLKSSLTGIGRYSLATTTTIYLVVSASIAASATAWGGLYARRVR